MRVLSRLSVATLVLLTTHGAALAGDEPCARAAQIVGAEAQGMTPAQCQEVLDEADEERWQLWLDMALALEHAGDRIAAVQFYGRFLDSVAERGDRPLSDAWAKLHADARAAHDRIDAELLATHGRIRVRGTPRELLASFEGRASEAATHTTPFVHYLPPGTHRLQVHHRGTDTTREQTFELAAGQALELHLDLTPRLEAPDAPTVAREAAEEVEGAPGDAADKVETESAARPAPPTGDASLLAVRRAGAPASRTSTVRDVGWLGVALGVGATALGAVFYFQGDGLISESRCQDQPWCEPTTDERAARRSEGEELQDRAIITWIAGGVLLVTGITAILVSGAGGDKPSEPAGEDASDTAGVTLDHVSPALIPGGAGVQAGLRF